MPGRNADYMSTEIISSEDEHGFTATIFYGGIERGKCVQIKCSAENGTFVQLEARQFWILVSAMLKYCFQL